MLKEENWIKCAGMLKYGFLILLAEIGGIILTILEIDSEKNVMFYFLKHSLNLNE